VMRDTSPIDAALSCDHCDCANSTRSSYQKLCSEECGSGGVSELKDSVGEDLSLDEGEDELG
jgi:hypothetical protein